MSRVADLTDKMMRLRAESKTEPITFNLLVTDDLDLADLAGLWLNAVEWKTSSGMVEKIVGDQLAGLLVERGRGIETSGHLVFATAGTRTERCTDEAGFWEAVLLTPHQLPRIFNANTARKGSLPAAIRDSFFEKVETVKPDAQPRPAAVPVEVLEANRQRKGVEQ